MISIDDKYSRKIYLQKNIKNKISFSIFDNSADFYMNNEYIFDNYSKKSIKVHIKNISKDLYGKFNNQNILIAYICNKLLKLPEKNFLNVIKKYKGLPYRSNTIIKNKNLEIINNSKSTNLNSAINLITNYNNIYLIIGGIAKEKNFEILSNYKDRIICIYLFGKSSLFIEKKLKKSLNVKIFSNLKLVVKEISKDVKKNNFKSNILFAPACTSFDQYKNFEHRGADFNKLIKKNFNKL